MIDPKKLAADTVQRLADSEPTDDSIEGMERLRGTPQESMFVVDGAELQRVIECTLEDAIYDSQLPPTPPPPSETPMTDHKHESVGVFSRDPCNAPRISICACGATQKVGSGTWTVPPNPRSFDVLPPEQRAELLAFSEWLKLPKPKVTFEVYRAEHLPPPSDPSEGLEAEDFIAPTNELLAIPKLVIPPPPSETKLKEAISELICAADELGPSSKSDRLDAARSSLESLYREQMTENERLEGELEAANQNIVILRSENRSIWDQWSHADRRVADLHGVIQETRAQLGLPWDFAIPELRVAARSLRYKLAATEEAWGYANAELSALRSLQLTPGEAQQILESQPMITSATREKLQKAAQ